jgi:hypothetical protein
MTPEALRAWWCKGGRGPPQVRKTLLVMNPWHGMTKRPPAESWWVEKLSADFTAD